MTKPRAQNNALQEYMSKLMLQHNDKNATVCISPDNARIPLTLVIDNDYSTSSHNSINSCLSPISSAVSPRSNRVKQSRWSNSSPAAMIQAAVELSQEAIDSRRSSDSVAGYCFSRNGASLLSCVDGIPRSRACPKQMLKSSMGGSPLVSRKGARGVPPPPSLSPSADRWAGKGTRRACASPPSPPCRKVGSFNAKTESSSPDFVGDRRALLVRSNSRRSSSTRSLTKSKESSRRSNRQLLKRSQSSSSLNSSLHSTKSQSRTASTKSVDYSYSMEDEITNTTIHTPTKLQYREQGKLNCRTSPILSRKLPETLRGPPY